MNAIEGKLIKNSLINLLRLKKVKGIYVVMIVFILSATWVAGKYIDKMASDQSVNYDRIQSIVENTAVKCGLWPAGEPRK